jgi:hypothetical protein
MRKKKEHETRKSERVYKKNIKEPQFTTLIHLFRDYQNKKLFESRKNL